MKHLHSGLIAAITVCAAASIGHAQQYPTKPIRMIIGFTAGSEVDVIGRMVAHEMSEKWSQRVVVDNRPGAGSTLAGAIVAGANPDGYTLFFNSVSHAATPALYPKAPFDTLRDFAGISQITSLPNVLIISPASGIKTTKDLITMVKQKSGMTYGHAGVGSGTHITGELFRQMAGIELIHVPYKGVPEVLTDTVTGRLNYAFAPIGNTLPFIKDKRLNALAVSTAARSAALPDVPTIAEAALPGYVFDHWYGMFAPSKTPRGVVNQLSQEVARILGLAEVRDRITVRGAAVRPSTPEAFDAFVRAEVAKITKVMQAGGVKVQ
ncbi:MAG: tripartite tricarboxylate transporter substrate binding protein [Betaproteobacteria bacterium]|nr:tripartite tricarboxylate transporter substrate binding protein [Betaproteobacteria bacterium]